MPPTPLLVHARTRAQVLQRWHEGHDRADFCLEQDKPAKARNELPESITWGSSISAGENADHQHFHTNLQVSERLAGPLQSEDNLLLIAMRPSEASCVTRLPFFELMPSNNLQLPIVGRHSANRCKPVNMA